MITLLDMWLPGRWGPQDSRPIRCPSASRLCVSHVLQSRACGHNEDMRLAVEWLVCSGMTGRFARNTQWSGEDLLEAAAVTSNSESHLSQHRIQVVIVINCSIPPLRSSLRCPTDTGVEPEFQTL